MRAATNGRVRKLVHRKRWGDLEGGLVGDSHTRVWNYATDVGTCGAWIQCARAGGPVRRTVRARAACTQARGSLRRRRQERALVIVTFWLGLVVFNFVLCGLVQPLHAAVIQQSCNCRPIDETDHHSTLIKSVLNFGILSLVDSDDLIRLLSCIQSSVLKITKEFKWRISFDSFLERNHNKPQMLT